MNIDKIKCHLAFGDPAAGTLRNYLYDMKKEKEKKIINITEDFSYGPLQDYEPKRGS